MKPVIQNKIEKKDEDEERDLSKWIGKGKCWKCHEDKVNMPSIPGEIVCYEHKS